jgi:hypothetical protein
MIVYHRTHAADEILAGGFRNAEGHYMTSDLQSGVWVADHPLDENEGADGDRVLAVEVPRRCSPTTSGPTRTTKARRRAGSGSSSPEC